MVRPGLCSGIGIELEEEDMVVVEATGGRSLKFLDYDESFSLKNPPIWVEPVPWASARMESRRQLEEAGRGCRKGKKVQLEQEEAAADRKGKVARLQALKALKALKALT